MTPADRGSVRSCIASGGTLMMGGVEAQLADASINLAYMPSAHKIEITPSLIRLGETVLPFTGGLIDADRVDRIEGAGVAFDFVIKNGRAAPGIPTRRRFHLMARPSGGSIRRNAFWSPRS
jgi:hypothetical protein